MISQQTASFTNTLFFSFYKKNLGMKLEESRGLKDRASSDSDILKRRNVTAAHRKHIFAETEFLPFLRKVRVEEYLENPQKTYSEMTQPSDSGAGTWSGSSSEYRFEKGEGDQEFSTK